MATGAEATGDGRPRADAGVGATGDMRTLVSGEESADWAPHTRTHAGTGADKATGSGWVGDTPPPSPCSPQEMCESDRAGEKGSFALCSSRVLTAQHVGLWPCGCHGGGGGVGGGGGDLPTQPGLGFHSSQVAPASQPKRATDHHHAPISRHVASKHTNKTIDQHHPRSVAAGAGMVGKRGGDVQGSDSRPCHTHTYTDRVCVGVRGCDGGALGGGRGTGRWGVQCLCFLRHLPTAAAVAGGHPPYRSQHWRVLPNNCARSVQKAHRKRLFFFQSCPLSNIEPGPRLSQV